MQGSTTASWYVAFSGLNTACGGSGAGSPAFAGAKALPHAIAAAAKIAKQRAVRVFLFIIPAIQWIDW